MYTLTNFGEILKVHETVACLVVIPQDLQHLRFLQVEPQRTHGDLELVVVHAPVLVCIKQLKRLLHLLLLLVRELRPRVRCASLGLGRGGGVHYGAGLGVPGVEWQGAVRCVVRC